MKNNYDEEYVNDLTDRVFLIKREIENGKLKISPKLISGFVESFNKVRLRADGKIDPDTVDGRIRAMGAAVRHFTEREEIKQKYSITDIQEAYFRLLFDNFEDYFTPIKNGNANPNQVSYFLSEKEDFVKLIDESFPEIIEHITEFWSALYEIGEIHLQDGKQLKANFSGDLFPAHDENAVSMAGLYIDTIILPCPILRVARLHNQASKKEFCRLLLKHVLTCMTYRDVALEDINPQILMILPDRRDFSADQKNILIERSVPYSLAHANCLFGRDFSEVNEFREFCQSLRDVEGVLKELKRPERLIFNTDWGNGADVQLKAMLADKDRLTAKYNENHPGMEVFMNCMGRMPQALAAKDNASYLGCTPYINAETSWIHYTWLLEYESLNFKRDNEELKNFHMVHALSQGQQEGLSWLGNIPINKVIELRRNDLMNEVREILSMGVNDLIGSNRENYQITKQKVVDNIDNALISHKRFLERARKDNLKLYGLEVAPCIINGTVIIAAALTGNVALGTIGAGLGLWGMPNIKDIKTKFKERDEKIDKYRKSSTGIMFSHIK